ncbi:hypothetical protein ACJJTC_009995 [Scirpophaga incertulas]
MDVWYIILLLILSATIPKVSPGKLKDYDYEFLSNEVPDIISISPDDDNLHKINSDIDEDEETNDAIMIDTNTLIGIKYRPWKRNVDLINSILTLPKHMNEAGRR